MIEPTRRKDMFDHIVNWKLLLIDNNFQSLYDDFYEQNPRRNSCL